MLVGQSCITHRDLITFDFDKNFEQSGTVDTLFANPDSMFLKNYVLRPFDQLMIKINAFEGNTEDFISRGLEGNISSNRLDYDPASVYFNSFSISDSGYVILPQLDKIKVAGMTVHEVQEKLNDAYKPYLRLVSTRVKLANSRFTVFGEVAEPGLYYLYNERNTLLDAISSAGDFTEFADRTKVRLLRTTDAGTKSIFLDLSRSDFLTSEYYFLQPNDVIYVEPAQAKAFDSSARSVGIVLSVISLSALILNLFSKK
jgi:polysaccharide export outer membrane protein